MTASSSNPIPDPLKGKLQSLFKKHIEERRTSLIYIGDFQTYFTKLSYAVDALLFYPHAREKIKGKALEESNKEHEDFNHSLELIKENSIFTAQEKQELSRLTNKTTDRENLFKLWLGEVKKELAIINFSFNEKMDILEKNQNNEIRSQALTHRPVPSISAQNPLLGRPTMFKPARELKPHKSQQNRQKTRIQAEPNWNFLINLTHYLKDFMLCFLVTAMACEKDMETSCRLASSVVLVEIATDVFRSCCSQG